MKVLDKITHFLSAILCGHCRELLKSQKKITLRAYTDYDAQNRIGHLMSYRHLRRIGGLLSPPSIPFF
jgi:hypothetical protein